MEENNPKLRKAIYIRKILESKETNPNLKSHSSSSCIFKEHKGAWI